MNLLGKLHGKNSLFWIITGCCLVALVGIADVVTGPEIAFSLFYLIPIVLVTWFAGRNLGIVIGFLAAISWFFADTMIGHGYSRPIIGYWNAAVRLAFFELVAVFLPALKALEHEKERARTDSLTGIANRRYFFELAETELDRARRYKRPLTIAYIDLDHFKAVNDQEGHRTGDRVLSAVVARAKSHLRKTDVMARLGGDEFVLLLPEAGEYAAQSAVPKVQAALLDEMQRHNWPVTFSIGVLTYHDGPISVDELIRRADDLMYSAKTHGRNAIAYAVYSAQTHVPAAPDDRGACDASVDLEEEMSHERVAKERE